MFSNLNLTDMETCFKAFRTEIIKGIPLEEDRFGIEPEVTIKVGRKKCRVYEVGVSYHGRSYTEGKKITWKDGLRAAYVILKYGIWAWFPFWNRYLMQASGRNQIIDHLAFTIEHLFIDKNQNEPFLIPVVQCSM